MESSILETLLVPWWKIVVYFATAVVGVIGIKISLTFDINTWMQDRRKEKKINELKKIASECGHVWTLYPDSRFSQCNLWMSFIATSTLTLAVANVHLKEKPLFAGTFYQGHIEPPEGTFGVSDYVGQRK